MNKKQRKDYNLSRNISIFKHYINGSSYNELSKKYDISPQRVSRIIEEVQSKGYGIVLSKKSTVKDRENYELLAIKLRELGRLNFAAEAFEEILTFVIKYENNAKKEIDILGHLRVTYDRLALQENNLPRTTDYLETALKYSEKAYKKSQTFDSGKFVAISSVHYASSLLSMYKLNSNKTLLSKAEVVVNNALKDFPGSLAHKSWPLKLKAEILIEKGEYLNAFEVLNTAEKCLLEGYNEELQDPSGEIKLQVWLSGIWIAKSKVCIKLKYSLLAKMYAESVLGLKDTEKILTERKKEAKLVITNLEL